MVCLLEEIRVQVRKLYGVLDQYSEAFSIDLGTHIAENGCTKIGGQEEGEEEEERRRRRRRKGGRRRKKNRKREMW